MATVSVLPAGPAARLLARFKAMQAEIEELRGSLHQPPQSGDTCEVGSQPACTTASMLLARFQAMQEEVDPSAQAVPNGSSCGLLDEHAAAATLMAKMRALLAENAALRAHCREWNAHMDEFVCRASSSSAPPPRSDAEASRFEEFKERLVSNGIDIRKAPRGCLESYHSQLQHRTAFLTSRSSGGLALRYSVVRLYLLAKIAGEEKCLIEHDRFDVVSGEQQTRMLPLEVRLHEGENWREALRRALQVEVGLDVAWQESYLQFIEDSYYCYEECQSHEGDVQVLPVVVQVHEVHANVIGMAKELAAAADKENPFERIGLPSGRDFVCMERSEDGVLQSPLHVWCWKSREYERNGKLKSFAKFLSAHGVDVSLFGRGDNKTLFKFYQEVKEKRLCTLKEVPERSTGTGVSVERVIEILKITLLAEVHARMRVLSQTEEYLEDGRKRKANQMLIKKLRQSDDWESAIPEVVAAKLGVPVEVQDECFSIDYDKTTYVQEVQPSKGYAGILSHYNVRTVTIYVTDPDHPELSCIGLPRGNDFVSREKTETGDELKVWTWTLFRDDETVTHFGGTGLEELSDDLHDVEHLVGQTVSHPQIAALKLDTGLQQALQKIRKCAERLYDIDATLGKVDLDTITDKVQRASSDTTALSNLKEFISANFTRAVTDEPAKVATLDSLPTSPTSAGCPSFTAFDVDSPDFSADALLANASIKEEIRLGLSDWGYDFFELHAQTDGQTLECYGDVVLAPLCAPALRLGKEAGKVRNFVKEMAMMYYDNPYHNAIHAAQVCHLSTWLTNALGVAAAQTDMEKAAFAIAALCHDIKHIGRNNVFCINTEHPLALRYNNQKVLENLHSATCFELLQSTNMLSGLSQKDRAYLRMHIIEYILATDMAEHFEMLSKFRVRCESSDFSVDVEADRRFVSRMCLKAGDIGHASLPWDLHKHWSLRVSQEFYAQGDEERRLGLPISALCDRAAAPDIAKSQKGFLDFVALPLFQLLGEYQTQSLTRSQSAQAQGDGEDRDDSPGEASRGEVSPSTVRSTSMRRPSYSLRRRSFAEMLAGCTYVQSVCVANIQVNKDLWQEDEAGVRELQEQLMKGAPAVAG